MRERVGVVMRANRIPHRLDGLLLSALPKTKQPGREPGLFHVSYG